jgi:hypothetical protein
VRDAKRWRFGAKLRVRNPAILGGLHFGKVVLARDIELVDKRKQFFAEFYGFHRLHDHTIFAAPSKSIVVAICLNLL